MSFAKHNYFQWRIQGGGHGGPVPPFGIIFLQKRSLLTKLVLNEHKICLKMLEMATLETQIFKNSGRECSQTPLESLRLRRSLVPPPFANPGSAADFYLQLEHHWAIL